MSEVDKGKYRKGLFNVSNFRFENEKVEKWVNLGVAISTDYDFRIKKTGFAPHSQHEGLLSFEFELELLPDIGKITFNGDCIFFSPLLETCIMIIKADKKSVLRKKNKVFMIALNNLLRRRCLDHAKEIGEKEGLHFDNYDLFLEELGLEHIIFKKGVDQQQILHLEGDKLKPSQNLFDIKNFAGFKEFIYYNEKIIPGKNSCKNIDNGNFDVKSDLYKPKILSKMSLLVQYHFIMKISPDIGKIEFDGQFILDSFKNEIGYLLKNEQNKLKKVLQNVIAKDGIIHSEKIAKKYGIGFSAAKVLKNLGLK